MTRIKQLLKREKEKNLKSPINVSKKTKTSELFNMWSDLHEGQYVVIFLWNIVSQWDDTSWKNVYAGLLLK